MGDMADLYSDHIGEYFGDCDERGIPSIRDQQKERRRVPFIRIIRETEKAWLISFNEDNPIFPKREWMPKSQCVLRPDSYEIEIPLWLIDQKGLE
jgi:hypothetical protein